MELAHLALVVSDQNRARRFYETYFGFGEGPSEVMGNNVLFIRNGDGFDLAMAQGEPGAMPDFVHFGFRADDAGTVDKIRARLEEDGVEIFETVTEPGYSSVKCRDPDGYVVEVYWPGG